MTGLLLFWIGGLVATVLNLAIEWSRMGRDHHYRHILRIYPFRVFFSSALMVIVWPILLTLVLAKERASEEQS